MHTYALSGFDMEKVVLREDLEEWDYGSYEGLTTEQIHVQRPGWRLFRDGCPGGESVIDVVNRADAVIKELREADNIAVFSSGHFLRVLAARWLGLAPGHGADFALGTASISVLGYEHSLEEPVIRSWNQQFAAE
jgi:probable phosphoglycerate mutase